MNPLAFAYGVSALIAGLVCLGLGIYVILRQHTFQTTLYFALTLALFWIGLFDALSTAAPNAQLAVILGDCVFFGWFCVYPIYLHFVLLFCNIKIGRAFLLYLPSALMFTLFLTTPYYLSGYKMSYIGYVFVPGPWHLTYMILVLAYSLTGLYFIFRYSRTAEEFYKRIQARLIFYSIIYPLFIGLLFDQILPIMGVPVPPLAIHAVATTIGLIGYALVRYSPMTEISRERITEAAADALFDGLFLTDIQGVVNYANRAGSLLTGYRADELLGKDISALFPSREEKVLAVRRKDGHFGTVDLKVFPISGERGFVYLARDLTPIARSRRAIKRMTTEQDQLIRREQRVIQLLARFLEARGTAELDELWNEVRAEGKEVEATLRPVDEIVTRYVKALAEAQGARMNWRRRSKRSPG